jgi:hypothetical protein
MIKFYPTKLLLIFSIAALAACNQARKNTPVIVNNKMNDIERLLNSTLPFVESLLKKHGEFFPLASAVETNDSITSVSTYDGDEHPESENVIADLKKVLMDGATKNDYKAIAIFYDVKVIDPNTSQKTDAIAVFVESKSDTTAFTLFYPYTLKNKELELGKSWKSLAERKVFVN